MIGQSILKAVAPRSEADPSAWTHVAHLASLDGQVVIRLGLVFCPAAEPRRRPVLFLHGLSAASNTFTTPEGTGGLARYVADRGHDAWIADWRGSHLHHPTRDVDPDDYDPSRYTLDHVVDIDIPGLLEAVASETDRQDRWPAGADHRVDVIAHCVGAGAMAMALAEREASWLDPTTRLLGNVVLSTLGITYRSPAQGQLKARTTLVEKHQRREAFRADRQPFPRDFLDPQMDEDHWVGSVKRSFELWTQFRVGEWAPYPEYGDLGKREFAYRLAFMYGEPFDARKITGVFDRGFLEARFGKVHLQLFRHVAQNLRHGYATPFDSGYDTFDLDRYGGVDGFRGRRITLVTGHNNRLWHRDSVDTCFEYLLNRGIPRDALRKYVIRGYAHQDLLWGDDAHRETYPFYYDGLEESPQWLSGTHDPL